MPITLEKGERVAVAGRGGRCPLRVAMGLGWDVARVKKGGVLGLGGRWVDGPPIDLDASALAFDAGGRLVDTVWYAQLQSTDPARAIRHSGDNRTGDGDGDDERIEIELGALPATTHQLIFTVNSFTGQDFARVTRARCRLVDLRDGAELVTIDLTERGRHTALIVARLARTTGGTGWDLQAIGEPTTGQTFHDLLPAVRPHLRP
jgi:tellurium resistance protein TerZ